MRDDPRTLADEREPVMEPAPAQRSHEEAESGAEGVPSAGAEEAWPPGGPEGSDGEDRAVGTASVPDDAEARDAEAHDAEAHDAHARDDGFRPADAETPAMAGAEAPAAEPTYPEPVDAERADGERVDGEPAYADRVDGEPVDAERVDAEPADAEPADAEPADTAAGGVPDDAAPAEDVPVPAAAYPGADSAGHDDLAGRDARQDEGWQGDTQQDEARQDEEPHGELMPGDVPEQPVSALFDESIASGFRDRWQQVQMQFVDDPRVAADQARALVDDVFTALHEGLAKQRGALDGWQSGQPDDTEQLRVAVRRYRDFLDRMLGV